MRDPHQYSDDSIFWLSIGLICGISLAVLNSGCATPVYSPNVLADQILYPHPEHSGHLVNRACASYSQRGACEAWTSSLYDLGHAPTRANLVRLKFLCQVGDRLFHPCPDQAGLCRNTFKRPFLGLGKPKKEVEVITLQGDDLTFLVAAKTTCARLGRYDAPAGL